MARTLVTNNLIADHTLTGAAFNAAFQMYDETKAYNINNTVFYNNSEWRAIANIPSTVEGDLQYGPITNANWEKIQPINYKAYPSNIQIFSNIPVELGIDVEETPDQLARLNIVQNHVIFNINETVIVSANVTTVNTNNIRTNSKMYLEISTDGGLTWNSIPNAESWMYNRTVAEGRDTASVTVPVTVSVNDRLRVSLVSGSSNMISTVSGACYVTVFAAAGGTGQQGIAGPVGPPGDLLWKGPWVSGTLYSIRDTVYYLGSSYTSKINGNTEIPSGTALNWDLIAQKGDQGVGSSVHIANNGNVIPGSPFNQLNFAGPDLYIQNASAGTANITVAPTKQKYTICVWAEKNAALGTNAYEWAFGGGAMTPVNGGIPIYVPAGYTARIAATGLSIPSGTASVRVELNGIDSGASTSTTASINPSSITEPAGVISIQNNDRLNFKTVTATGTSWPCIANCWIEFTEL
jgi:hypothetical protein